METDGPGPAPPRASEPASERLGRPRGPLATVTLGVACLCLAGFAAAGILLAIPVRTPGVQDCGTPAAYLLGGRVDVRPDGANQILGPDGEVITLEERVAREARETPCQERVAALAVPAAIIVAAATVVGAITFVVELLLVRPRARRAAAPPVNSLADDA